MRKLTATLLGPIVGSIIADLVTQGNSNLPIEPFRIDRFDNTEETPQ